MSEEDCGLGAVAGMGEVWLVGAGPGPVDLLTLQEELRSAESLIYGERYGVAAS